MIPQDLRSEIIRYCQRMDQKGWVAGHDGNITVRLANGMLVATPASRAKFGLVEDELLELDEKGAKLAVSGDPFSELAIHLEVYGARSDVKAIVHAHPPQATAVGCANQEMVTYAVPEAVVTLGPGVPLVGLGLPGSESVMTDVRALVPHYDAIMMGGNGVFAWGKTLAQAFQRLELVEHLAHIFLSAVPLGGPQLLSREQIGELLEERQQAGFALPADPARPTWFA